jgi:tripartite-type tricarboxylate transporter receptor subunit TctC
MKTLLRIAMAIALAGAAAFAYAQYPAKPVKIIVPYAPGGTSDFVTRLAAQKLSEIAGKTFIVENRTGAAGRIGYEAGARSPGDGYTLVATDTSYAMLPGLYGTLNWNHEADLVPVTVVAETPLVIIASPNAKADSLKELIAHAKSNPGKLNYGSGGAGSSTHLAAELFKSVAGVEITHVPFKGAGDAMTGVLTGSVDVLITAIPTAISYIKSDRVKPLAVTASKRSAALPEVATVGEAGLAAFTVSNWFGITAPKGTPKEVVSYVQSEIAKTLGAPDMREKLVAQGAEPSGITPEEFGTLIREETKRWTEVIRKANVKID